MFAEKQSIHRESKILFCCGSRPEIIKILPVFQQLKIIPNITTQLCSTGQHTDLLSQHLDTFGLIPDFQLDVMRKGQSLDQLMAQLFAQLPRILDHVHPDIVVIQGDTASAMASGVIAAKKGIPLAHIEAGLRTHDTSSPFPEEIFRKKISSLATWHFCPTEQSRQNLLRQGIYPKSIFVTGNTSVDMVLRTHAQLTDLKGDNAPP